MTDDLKPCPFCGGEARYDNSDHGPWEWIKCDECGARGPTVDYNRRGHTACDMWNQRTEQTATQTGTAAENISPDETVIVTKYWP